MKLENIPGALRDEAAKKRAAADSILGGLENGKPHPIERQQATRRGLLGVSPPDRGRVEDRGNGGHRGERRRRCRGRRPRRARLGSGPSRRAAAAESSWALRHSGNVAEWTWDRNGVAAGETGAGPMDRRAPVDPTGPRDGVARVVLGGPGDPLRGDAAVPSTKRPDLGLRLVRSLTAGGGAAR